MENNAQPEEAEITKHLSTRHFLSSSHPLRPVVIIVVIAVVLGTVTGFIMANKGSAKKVLQNGTSSTTKAASQDTRTFRDFAEGVIKLKPTPKEPTEYTEGTHILEREGAVPVALTSSVVDLALFEGKKVKVYGETQKALKEGWLMDVGKVEELQMK